jgi:hypothetical protein
MSAPTIKPGQRFGRLLVVGDGARWGDEHKRYEVVCDCGNVRNVRASSLTQGLTVSCGCQRIERARQNIRRAIALSIQTPFGRQSIGRST